MSWALKKRCASEEVSESLRLFPLSTTCCECSSREVLCDFFADFPLLICVFSALWFSFCSKKLKSIRLQRLELMWICRDMHDFKWFADAVQELKSKVCSTKTAFEAVWNILLLLCRLVSVTADALPSSLQELKLKLGIMQVNSFWSSCSKVVFFQRALVAVLSLFLVFCY